MHKIIRKIIIILCSTALLVGCVIHRDAFTIKGKKYQGHYKVGQKYKVNKRTYTPKEVDDDYGKVGFASWYGPGFYGKQTANGEIFTGNDLTAAHDTLPLPSIVRVVNLENGKSVIVRVNDRGPFRGGKKRILDLSEHAAEILGIKEKGTALVSIKFLAEKTRDLHEKLGIIKIKK